MAQYVDANTKGFVSAGVIKLYARVLLGSGGTITEAGITDREIGVAMTPAVTSGDIVTVKLRSGHGTVKAIAGAAITRGATVFSAAAGRMSVSASTAFSLGVAMEAAGAIGDIIEVMYVTQGAAVA